MSARAALIALFGPTGVGKTAVAIALAGRLRELAEDPVAVSADALQIYAGLETLTGAADATERAALEHRLIAFVPATESFSAGRYAALAHAEIDGLLAAGRRPIVVGGTGLYLRAALADLELRRPPPPGLRERLMAELDEHGAAALHTRLAAVAPWRAAEIDPGDSHRIVRALELHYSGALSQRQSASQLWTQDTRHPTLLAGLVMEREALYDQIDRRVDAMVAAGAIEEVQRAAAAGAGPTARKALGFPELLAGDVDAMKQHTRQYAKRQLTWLRKLPAAQVIDVTGRSADDVAAEVIARWLASAG